MSGINAAPIERLWDGPIGEDLEIKTPYEEQPDAYGERQKNYSTSSTTRGRVKVLNANEVNKEFGYLVPGDAIALVKLGVSVGQKDRIVARGVAYDVIGIVQKMTHQEIALKKLI